MTQELQQLFGLIQFEPGHIATLLQPYITAGFTSNRLTIEMLTIVSNRPNAPAEFPNIRVALEHGTQYFDALAYFQLDKALRPPVVRVTNLDPHVTTQKIKIAEAIAYLFFFLLTRANVPRVTTTRVGTDVPAFLYNFLGLTEPPANYAARLASFDLGCIEHRWIKEVDLTGLPQAVISRISLGIAGYRVLMPFKYYAVEISDDDAATKAHNLIAAFLERGYMWDIHPLTRNPDFITLTGSLNKNCDNIMLKTLTQDTINKLVAQKIIFKEPVETVRDVQYRGWTDHVFDQFYDKIFKQQL